MSIMLENHIVISNEFLPRPSKITRPQLKDTNLTEPCSSTSSSSSSSIGMNSDDDDDHDDDYDHNDEEVESKFNNSSFNSAVISLEQALPLRRGISNFYSGKSKSFASLGDAACSSIKDITKAENAYSRKRKNLLAHSLFYDKGRTSPPKTPGIVGGIEKRSTNTSRSTLAFAVAMNNFQSQNNENGSFTKINERQNSKTPSLSPPLSPVPPPPWRSFSLADLQHCAVSVTSLKSNLMGKRTKRDEVL